MRRRSRRTGYPRVTSVAAGQRDFVFRYRSSEHWLEVFRTYYGPLLEAFAALEPPTQASLGLDLLALTRSIQPSGRSLDGRSQRVP